MSQKPSAAARAVHTSLTRSGIPAEEQIPLAAHTTFRIGGPAALAAFPENAEQVRGVLDACRAHGVHCAVIGNGSNLLCPDDGYDGCVLFTTAMKEISVDGTVITAAAGASLASVCITARDRGLLGLAFAYGIPGSVGGAVYMNAGAYGGEICDILTDVTYLCTETGECITLPTSACGFGYRKSRFSGEGETPGTCDIILSAHFALGTGEPGAIRAEMEDIAARRREKQPLEYPSAGSAFKRYPGRFTAQLIDEAGLKGYTIGGAQVSEKHAGFIINRGGATERDVFLLIEHIRDRIEAIHGIRIVPEIRLLADCIIC